MYTAGQRPEEPQRAIQKLGRPPNLHLMLLSRTLEAKSRKENAMNATELMLILVLIRLVLPFGLLLLIGEWLQSQERSRPYRR